MALIHPRSDLFPFQRDKLVPLLVGRRRTAAFVRMGLGKTVSALTALVDLGAPRTLVIAPLRVAARVWPAEAAAWEHTRGLRVNVLAGCDPRQRLVRLGHRSDVDVVNYELLAWLCDQVDLEARYGAVVFDELSRMRHPGARWFRRVRTRTMAIPVRFGLTGTPVGNHYAGLWGEMFAVAGEEPLGPSKALYLAQYFTAYPVGEHAKVWALNHGCDELINERIRPWAFSLDPADAPPLPPVVVNQVHVSLPRHVRDLSARLARELRVRLASGEDLVALSSGTLAQKVRQLAGGAVYLDGARWERVHDEKLDALAEVVDGAQGRPLLVFYWYRHELERILARFPQARALDADAWNRGEIEVMVVHPASAGHGLNLQFGGSDIAWYTLPWPYELFVQGCARLARPGQRERSVVANVLLAGETDLAVLQFLRERAEAEARLSAAVRL